MVALALSALVLSALVMGSRHGSGGARQKLPYSEFIDKVGTDKVERVKIDQVSGRIDGALKNGTEFHTQGPQSKIPTADIKKLEDHNVSRDYKPRPSHFLGSLLLWLPIGLLVAFWWWMGRRAQGQMSGMMNMGRSRAKVYTTE